MLNIPVSRFVWTFLVGFIVTSNLNWAVAELLLNDWAMPRFDGFMRTMDSGGAAATTQLQMLAVAAVHTARRCQIQPGHTKSEINY